MLNHDQCKSILLPLVGEFVFNLKSEFLIQLLPALFKNTSLQDCNLQLLPPRDPIVKLLLKILERNLEMLKVNPPKLKEWIYNKFTPELNEMIEAVKKDKLMWLL
jgi:hypothetical protein